MFACIGAEGLAAQPLPSQPESQAHMPCCRSLGHAADAAAAAGTAGGRTMRTRSMTAAQEAAQNGLAACGILGSEATGPAMPLAADEPDHEPSEVPILWLMLPGICAFSM